MKTTNNLALILISSLISVASVYICMNYDKIKQKINGQNNPILEQLDAESQFLQILNQAIIYSKSAFLPGKTAKRPKQFFINAQAINEINDTALYSQNQIIFGQAIDTNACKIRCKGKFISSFIAFKKILDTGLANIKLEKIKDPSILMLYKKLGTVPNFTDIVLLEKNCFDALQNIKSRREDLYSLYLRKIAWYIGVLLIIIILYNLVYTVINNLGRTNFGDQDSSTTNNVNSVNSTPVNNGSSNQQLSNAYSNAIGYSPLMNINSSYTVFNENPNLKKVDPCCLPVIYSTASKQNASIKLTEVLNELDKFSINHRNYGSSLTIVLIAIILMASYYVNFVFIPTQANIIEELIRKDKPTLPLVGFYLGRVLIFGSFSSAALYFIYRLIKSSFDQSVRYRKKRHGLTVFKEIINIYPGIKVVELSTIMEVYDHIVKPVDSAFTVHENGKGKLSKNNEFSVKDGSKEVNIKN